MSARNAASARALQAEATETIQLARSCGVVVPRVCRRLIGGDPDTWPAPSRLAHWACRLDPARVQCFYGEEEAESLCPDPVFDRAERVRTRGGHHFDGDYEALAGRILEGAGRRLERRS